ncbi:MAG TPA: dihydrofolate reductase family protein [Gemmatimonadota bacterium]|nr:dihydrofolate reductase family protein [Gemmatimonadota bacterium]
MREEIRRFLKRLLGSGGGRPSPGAPEAAAPEPRDRGRTGRKIHLQVACSLDGYIAGPDGEADWIVHDPTIDFDEIFGRFDTLLMGRRTYEELGDLRGQLRDFQVVVVSSTLRQEDHPDVRVVAEPTRKVLAELRARTGKDIWLFGGGELFRSLMEMDEVDVVELAIVPVLLGGGTQLFPAPAGRRFLSLESYRSYPSGIVLVAYSVRSRDAGGVDDGRPAGAAPGGSAPPPPARTP